MGQQQQRQRSVVPLWLNAGTLDWMGLAQDLRVRIVCIVV
jgi:hypothetical protein